MRDEAFHLYECGCKMQHVFFFSCGPEPSGVLLRNTVDILSTKYVFCVFVKAPHLVPLGQEIGVKCHLRWQLYILGLQCYSVIMLGKHVHTHVEEILVHCNLMFHMKIGDLIVMITYTGPIDAIVYKICSLKQGCTILTVLEKGFCLCI